MKGEQHIPLLYVLDYHPLNELRNEIRLLIVHKVDCDLEWEHCQLEHSLPKGPAVVCCSIEHVSLDMQHSYKALSYCWGDRSESSTIHVNGSEVQVTNNLEAALQELRSAESVRLWVDALCINQSDYDERGRQILRMSDIYKSASETICWLGKEAKDTSLAFELIRILARVNGDSVWVQYENALNRLYKQSKNHEYRDEYEAHWDAFLQLFGRPYWRRVWIIQEIASSKKVWVQCGSQCVVWEHVVVAVNTLPTAGGRSRISVVSRIFSSDLAFMTDVISIDALRGRVQEAKSKSEYGSLWNVMTRASTALATKSCDKVYGLLAITKDGQDIIPHPDYTLSANEIRIMTTAAIIAASDDLDIICYARPLNCTNLPSWVPQWTEELPSGNMTWANSGRQDLYNATGRSQGGNYQRMPHKGEFLNQGLVLKARGFVLDVFNGLGAVDLTSIPPLDVDETIYRLIQPEPEKKFPSTNRS